MFYILQINYSLRDHIYSDAILLDSIEDKEAAQEKLKSYKGYTGPQFAILLELDSNANTQDIIMPFGKYKGEHISEIDDSYLIWLYVKRVFVNDSIKALLVNRAKSAKELMDRLNEIERSSREWRKDREEREREYYRTHRFELM